MVTARRLPGIRFEAQPPPLPEVLPRMDIACFVGFAASGPLHLPIVIEDPAQFSAIFGDEVALAWDEAHGERRFAYLSSTVRAFFRNGGRRCWVIRVANEIEASFNLFPLPGLVKVRQVMGETVFSPALARSRSVGSASDNVRVATSLLSRSIRAGLLAFNPAEHSVEIGVRVSSSEALAVGDLLRLTLRAQDALLIVPIDALLPASTAGSPFNRRVLSSRPLLFRLSSPFAPASPVQTGNVLVTHLDGSMNSYTAEYHPGQAIPLQLTLPNTKIPAPGDLIRADFSVERLWLSVRDVQIMPTPPVGNMITVQVIGEGEWLRSASSPALVAADAAGEILSFELAAQHGLDRLTRLSDLGFVPGQPRFWDSLPVDADLYSMMASDQPLPDLWHDAAEPRFPLAGSDYLLKTDFYFPLAVPIIASDFSGALPQTPSALERDGLANFDANLFLDPKLRGFNARSLIEQINFLRYQSGTSFALRGIYTALDLDEVTLIAVPDAVHLGWTLQTNTTSLLPPIKPPTPPTPEPETFIACGLKPVPVPTLTVSAPDATNSFHISWETNSPLALSFILEESNDPDPSRGSVLFTGTATRLDVYGRPAGDYYYRVRAVFEGRLGDWSDSKPVRVGSNNRWVVNAPPTTPLPVLLDVQTALLQFCAARGDLLAVLSMAAHYRENAAVAHVAALTPVGFGQSNALTYGAIYHPWLIIRDESRPDALFTVPPDGTMSGLLALRAAKRGAWIAPANEELRDVVALIPGIAETQWLPLQGAQINLIRQEPHGFVVLNEDTLAAADDRDLRPINVRRLLILLRRLALTQGSTYVFEPNDDTFQRRVQRGFERLMEYMFLRGAFAGDQPGNAFQVVTNTTLNTPLSMEQGRFIVELRVAPSLPMRFLTVRLVQSGEGSTAAEVR